MRIGNKKFFELAAHRFIACIFLITRKVSSKRRKRLANRGSELTISKSKMFNLLRIICLEKT